MVMPPKRILVVDDDPVMARTVARVLGRDFDVKTVESGADALIALEAGGFSGVVSDIDMPNMSGPELYRKVVEIYPAMANHFVFFTANDGMVPLLNVPVLLKGASSNGLLKMIHSIT